MDTRLELVIDSKSMLGEGPWWDCDNKVLHWIDSFDCKIHRFNPKTNENITFITDQYIGCAIPKKDKGLISCMQHGIYYVDIEKGETRLISNIESDIGNNRLNDGKCDSLGRLWFGSMSMTADQEDRDFETTGSFYKVDKSFEVCKMFGNVGISNGIAWNADETTMYYIDSMTSCVVSYEFDIDKGSIRKGRIVAKINKSEGIPDGMTIDSEGMIWIAHYGGRQISRWDPKKGRKIDKIEIPAPNVTSCTFGGENLDELYITTARCDMSQKDLAKYPYAGGLFKIALGIKGLPLYKFG